MKYKIQLSEEAIQEIQDTLGVTEGILYLKKGSFYAKKRETVRLLSQKYAVETENCQKSIDYQYRKKMLSDIQVGAIVKIRYNNKPIHLIITDMREETFDAIKIKLSVKRFKRDGIILEKNKDVFYINPTYKEVTMVGRERFLGFSYNDIIHEAGTIAGKIINESKLQEILELKVKLDEDIEKKKKKKNNNAVEV